jgi:hypothetical protein
MDPFAEGRIHRQATPTTMAQAESKKNARLPDKAWGKICGAVMTPGTRVRLSTLNRCQIAFAWHLRAGTS